MSEPVFVPPPRAGRRFTSERRVYLGDTTASGRLRLDALARYLQDVAADDAADAGLAGAWVLRRLAVRVDRLPRYREDVELTTFCSGVGSHVAERRTQLRVDGSVGGSVAIEAAGLWVFVDEQGRPARLDSRFFEHYGPAAGGRRVRSRLTLPGPSGEVELRPWSLRTSDFDLLGHMNNAAHWEAVEEELARYAPGARIVAAQLEHRRGIDQADSISVGSTLDGGLLATWLVNGAEVRASARIALRIS